MNWKRYRFVLLLAKRDLLEDRRISLVVIAMLSFSFLNLAFFPAFISGLSGTFTSNIVETQTGHISIQAEEGRIQNADSLTRKVAALEGVREVEKRLEFSATVSHRSESVTGQVIGTSTPDSEVYSSRMKSGDMLSRGDEGKIVLGDNLAKEEEQFGFSGIGVESGRIIEFSYRNQSRELKLKGSIGKPGPGTIINQMLVTYETAEDVLDAQNEADTVKVLLENPEEADDFKTKLKKINTRGEIQTWREVSDIASSFEDTFGIVTGVVSIVGLVVALASIGVVIFINTNKRARETGIARSIGAERGEILQIFLLEALIFGIIGITIGNIAMIGIHEYLVANPIQTPIGSLKTDLTTDLLVTRSLWMLSASLVAGFIPAYLISRRNIIDTIEQR